MTLRGAILATSAVLGMLVVLWLFKESPRLLRELLILFGVMVLVFFAGRAAWYRWRAQSPRVWSFGLLGCLGVAISGWISCGIMSAIIRAMGQSFAMIIVAPMIIVFSTLAGLAGLGAMLAGIAVVAGALAKPTPNAALIVIGGAVSIVLNAGFIWALLRVLG